MLGVLALQAGQFQKSIQLMGEALALDPDNPDVLCNLAECYLRQCRFEPASQCYRRLAELLPQSAEALHRLGVTQEQMHDWEAAAESYRRALAVQPDSPDLHGSLGRLQCKQGAFAEGVESYRRALALDANRHDIYNQMGNALAALGKFEAAAEAFRRALALQPHSAETAYGLGYLFERQGDLDSAQDSYRKALELNPRMGAAYLHLGATHFIRGDRGKATECAEMLRKVDPDPAEANCLLALVHLQQGNFPLGWSEYEARWGTAYGLRYRRKFRQPLWKGEPLEGSRILLHAEQGLGDTLQFVRYVPLVAARGGKVVLEVQPRLQRLLARTPGAEAVIPRNEALPEFAWQCPLMSLPWAFATELHSVPAPIPYVCPDPAQVNEWGERLAGNTLRVGLAWSGNPGHSDDLWRSIPMIRLARLMEIPDATFYSLQMGPGTEQIGQLPPQHKLIDLAATQKDFADTAAIVANLDLVISVDTAVAHLAGAMGKPVWILLQKSPDWRWLLERDDSPWYPTARLIRQSTLGNWQDVVARVEHDLQELAGRTAVRPRNSAP